MYRALFYCLAYLIIFPTQVDSQHLPRRVFLGIKMEELTSDARQIMALNFTDGILITEVFTNSTAEKAGFRRGDILLKINDNRFNSTSDITQYLSTQHADEHFDYELYRDKKILKGTAVFQPMPGEVYPGLNILYTEVNTLLGEQRMIISKPANHTQKLPAILFIGGVGCYSLDFPFDSTRSEVQLLNNLSRSGFLCARAEKTGVGDNAKTKPCEDVGFLEEMQSYVQMVQALKKRTDVDSDKIYIFGHSMGGVFAPLIARETNITGIIGYGTIGSNFIEYLVKTRKTIAQAYDLTPEASDDLVKKYCECAVYYFTDKMTPEQADQKQPGCEELLTIFEARSRLYNDELYSLNIPSLWKPFNGKVLMIWGSADFISSENDHEMIVGSVNRYHPGNASFSIAPNCDHGMRTATSFTESKNSPGVYNKKITEITLKWLNKN